VELYLGWEVYSNPCLQAMTSSQNVGVHIHSLHLWSIIVERLCLEEPKALYERFKIEIHQPGPGSCEKLSFSLEHSSNVATTWAKETSKVSAKVFHKASNA
jgi:hypothetical protein